MLALPTILTLPGAVHTGIAFVNSLCSGPPVHDCAWPIVALGGALYGVALGFAPPVLVLASLSWAVLTVGNGRIARWFQTAPRGALIFAWVVILGRVAWLYSDFDVGISSPSRLASLARHEDLSGTTERRAVSYQ